MIAVIGHASPFFLFGPVAAIVVVQKLCELLVQVNEKSVKPWQIGGHAGQKERSAGIARSEGGSAAAATRASRIADLRAMPRPARGHARNCACHSAQVSSQEAQVPDDRD